MLPAYARLRVEPQPSLSADVNRARDDLSAALARHAAAVTADDATTATTIAALNELRANTLVYVNVLEAACGWGNPFDALGDDEEDVDVVESGPRGVRLTLQADFVVDPSVDDALGRLEDLMHRDWPPQQWHGEGFARSHEEWQVTDLEGTPETPN
jgi:hypothetical protein